MVVKAGGVQWTTAGTRYCSRGSTYQSVCKKRWGVGRHSVVAQFTSKGQNDDSKLSTFRGRLKFQQLLRKIKRRKLHIIAGDQKGEKGLIKTQTAVNVFTAEVDARWDS